MSAADDAHAADILKYSELLVWALDKAGHAAVARPIVAALFGMDEGALTPSALDERGVESISERLIRDAFLHVAAAPSLPDGGSSS
jgi:hypothetical protein